MVESIPTNPESGQFTGLHVHVCLVPLLKLQLVTQSSGPRRLDSVTKDLTTGVDKPNWPLSSYGPAKGEPNLVRGLDESAEELRWRAVSALKAGNVAEYVRDPYGVRSFLIFTLLTAKVRDGENHGSRSNIRYWQDKLPTKRPWR